MPVIASRRDHAAVGSATTSVFVCVAWLSASAVFSGIEPVREKKSLRGPRCSNLIRANVAGELFPQWACDARETHRDRVLRHRNRYFVKLPLCADRTRLPARSPGQPLPSCKSSIRPASVPYDHKGGDKRRSRARGERFAVLNGFRFQVRAPLPARLQKLQKVRRCSRGG